MSELPPDAVLIREAFSSDLPTIVEYNRLLALETESKTLNPDILAWSRSDPAGLLAAARQLAAKRPNEENKDAHRLMNLMTAEANPNGARHYLTEHVLNLRPQALVEAIQILNAHRDEVVKVMTRYGYTDARSIGGYLDRDLPDYETLNVGNSQVHISERKLR